MKVRTSAVIIACISVPLLFWGVIKLANSDVYPQPKIIARYQPGKLPPYWADSLIIGDSVTFESVPPGDGAWELDSNGVWRKLWHTDTLVIIVEKERRKKPKPPKNGGLYCSTGGWEGGPIHLFADGRSRDTIFKHEIIYY